MKIEKFYELMSKLLQRLPKEQHPIIDEIEKLFQQYEEYVHSLETDAKKWQDLKKLLWGA